MGQGQGHNIHLRVVRLRLKGSLGVLIDLHILFLVELAELFI